MIRLLFAFAFTLFFSSQVLAGKADVLEVKITKTAGGTYQVSATVQHADDGWQHHADRWEILDMEGNILDTRVLMHPHTPAPFTRSISGAKIPEGIQKVRVRAHDNVHGYGGEELVIDIP
ncbi:MAG: hypothetical protein QNJ17_17200 [Desulfocapsaceae bacterium]|nr:hypothetical protein [Desulfocapsaceae bacterium]